jgi:hypothetical protein
MIKSRAVVFATLLFFTSSARAGVLSGTVSASTSGPGASSQSANFGGVTSTSQLPLLVNDNNTGQGAGSASGDAFGNFSVASHACVEPNPMFGVTSSAGGSGSIGYSDTFRIQSATLADGTPVSIDFCVIAGFNKQNNDTIAEQSETQTGDTLQAFFSAGNISVSGNYSFSESRLFTNSSTTGLLASSQATEFTVTGNVGQSVGVSVQLNCQNTAFVDPGNVGDVQVQSSLVWGGLAETAGVTLVSLNTGLTMPDMVNCTPAYVQAHIPLPLTVPVPGDYNNNGIVDAADYTVWREKLGTSTNLPNDTTPASVTQADYDVWKSNYGNHPSGSGASANAAVPEPASVVLIWAGLAASLFPQRRWSVRQVPRSR